MNEEIQIALSDPIRVHAMMLRGEIAWTPENLRHLLGDRVHEAASAVVAARYSPNESWDDLNEAIGSLADALKAPALPA
jgi:hypothetical protein